MDICLERGVQIQLSLGLVHIKQGAGRNWRSGEPSLLCAAPAHFLHAANGRSEAGGFYWELIG